MEVVELCRFGDRSIGQVCLDLGLGETAVRRKAGQRLKLFRAATHPCRRQRLCRKRHDVDPGAFG